MAIEYIGTPVCTKALAHNASDRRPATRFVSARADRDHFEACCDPCFDTIVHIARHNPAGLFRVYDISQHHHQQYGGGAVPGSADIHQRMRP